MAPGLFAALVVMILTLFGIGTRYYVFGDLNVIHGLLSLFFSANLLVCYWEMCLFLKRDYIEERTEYWRTRQRETGRTPAVEFLLTRVPLRRIFSPRVWSDVWATYLPGRRVVLGPPLMGIQRRCRQRFFTPLPTLVLYAALTLNFLPAVVTGMLGLILSWQWAYATSVYWVSFFMAGRQRLITRTELFAYVGALNAPWVVFGLLGMYVSARLILDGDCRVLGF